MHEWHTNTSKNIQRLIDQFIGYQFSTDYGGNDEVKRVVVTNRVFATEDEALNYVTRTSYGGSTAYLAAFTTKKLSKAYQNAFDNFLSRKKEYEDFEKGLTIAYGRKASKVTCPECGSSINLAYGKRFRTCPVCGSRKIISDSNWKILETKKRMAAKAADNLSVEAEKNDVTFLCGIEWHC